MNDKLKRIARAAGSADLVAILSERLSTSELSTLLLTARPEFTAHFQLFPTVIAGRDPPPCFGPPPLS